MKSAWSAAAGAFSFSAGPHSGTLNRSNEPPGLAINLGDTRIGGAGAPSWRMERDDTEGSAHPVPETAYIQQPYVVAPFALKTPSDFRLTGFFRATDDGIDADFRLATVLPVTNVSLELFAEWSKEGYRPLPELAKNRRYPCPGVEAGIIDFGSGRAAPSLTWASTASSRRLLPERRFDCSISRSKRASSSSVASRFVRPSMRIASNAISTTGSIIPRRRCEVSRDALRSAPLRVAANDGKLG